MYITRYIMKKWTFTLQFAFPMAMFLCWYRTQHSGSELPCNLRNVQVPSSLAQDWRFDKKRGESKISSWPCALATFAINRAYVGGITIFSIAISPSSHFPGAVFPVVLAVLNEQITFSHGASIAAINLQAWRIAAGPVRVVEDCDRHVAAGLPREPFTTRSLL